MDEVTSFDINLRSAVTNLNIEHVSNSTIDYGAFSAAAVGVRPTTITVNSVG